MKMNKSGWHIKGNCWILMLAAIFWLLLGCASTGPKVRKMEKGFDTKGMKIGLIDFKSFHLGQTGYGQAGTLIKTREQKEYARSLDWKYDMLIEQIIKGKAPFKLVTGPLDDMPKLSAPETLHRPSSTSEQEREKREKRERNRKLVKQFVESNGLNGALYVKPSHTVASGFMKKVALRTCWIIYDHTGREAINIGTYYKPDKASEVFPSTLDPRYEAVFLHFFEMSANDFISVLVEEN